MGRNPTVALGWCLMAAGGGMSYSMADLGGVVTAFALLIASAAVFIDAWNRFDGPRKTHGDD